MKLIIDIRFSVIENAIMSDFGKPFILENKKNLSAVNTRFVLKLREIGFSLPDYDHICIRLTSSLPAGEMINKGNYDPYHQFFSDYHIGVSPEYFNSLKEDEKITFLIYRAVALIQKFYCNSDEEKASVARCAEIILEGGEHEKIIYKQKKADHCIAQVVVRVLNADAFQAYVRVLKDQAVLNEVAYPRTLGRFELIFQFGTIIVNKSSVRVKPRKNSLSPLYGFSDFIVPIPPSA